MTASMHDLKGQIRACKRRLRRLERTGRAYLPDWAADPIGAQAWWLHRGIWSPEYTKEMMQLSALEFRAMRARPAEKAKAREEDARALESGEMTREQLARENGRFVFPDAPLLLGKSARLF